MEKFLGKALGGHDGASHHRDENEGLYQGGGNMTHGGAYPAGGGIPYPEDENLESAAHHAAGHSNEEPSFFTSILGQLGERRSQVVGEGINEEEAIRHHQQYFSSPNSSAPEAATNSGIGNAAALQALKLFTSSSSPASSQSQNAFIGLAMSQAAKLFDAQVGVGNVTMGVDKSSAVMKAGEMALRMYVQSQGRQGHDVGGAGGEGLGGLLSLASKFLQ